MLFRSEKRQSKEYRGLYIGKTEEVLFEEEKEIEGVSYQIGHTKTYVKVALKTDRQLSNQIVTGKIVGFLQDDMLLMEN